MYELKSKIKVEQILLNLGFSKNEIGFQFDFGNCNLIVTSGFNESMRYGYHFMGYYFSGREASLIQFSLPMEVDSFEMGVALISYYLKKCPFEKIPDWLMLGLKWNSLLPWEREREKFNSIPKAEITRDWFRIVNKELKQIIKSSSQNELFTFSFNGEIFKIVGSEFMVCCPAKGNKWESEVRLEANKLIKLPIRITSCKVLVYRNEGKLVYDRYSFQID